MARQFDRFAVAPLAGLAALVAPEVAAAGPAIVDLVLTLKGEGAAKPADAAGAAR